MIPFGNNPSKIERYLAFWNRSGVSRPLVGFVTAGWFPVRDFSSCASRPADSYVTPASIDVNAFLGDHLRLLREGEVVDDDLIRGACPTQTAIPWLPGIVGCRLRVLPDNIAAEERRLGWAEALGIEFDTENEWLRKYLEFAGALVKISGGRFPVSHGPEVGPTDLHALLRGHTQSVMDLVDEPENSRRLLERLGGIFREATETIWRRLPLFQGGYFDAQYSLWAPGPIVRLQEDATAVYSPALYRRFVQPVDRAIAGAFANAFIHLHSTSMFLLDAFLEIGEIRCFEVNRDVRGPALREMVCYFRCIQEAGRPLLIRGSFTPGEMRFLMDSLDPRGLFLYIMVNSLSEIEALRPLVGM